MGEGPDLEAIRDLVDELDALTAELREAGADVPAIERNASRIEAVVRVLEQHLPPELVED